MKHRLAWVWLIILAVAFAGCSSTQSKPRKKTTKASKTASQKRTVKKPVAKPSEKGETPKPVAKEAGPKEKKEKRVAKSDTRRTKKRSLKKKPRPKPKPVVVADVPKEDFETLSEYEQHLRMSRSLAQSYFQTGLRLYKEFRYDEAEVSFKHALRLDPLHTEAQKYLLLTQWINDKREPSLEINANNLYQMKLVLIRQKEIELERTFNAGYDLYDMGKYDEAIKQFELALEMIRWFPYQIDKNDYARRATKLIYDAKKKQKFQKYRERLKKEETALHQAEKEWARLKEYRKAKLDRLRKRATDALLLNRYTAAEKICREILEQDPGNKIGKRLLNYAIKGRHHYTLIRSIEESYESFQGNWETMAQAVVPYNDAAVFPGKREWERISRRHVGVAPEIDIEPEEIQRIRRVLANRRVSLAFQDTPLSEVVSFLQDITGLNIAIDPDVEADKPVRIQLKDALLQNALNLIMDQTDLMYIFKDNVIFITEEGQHLGKGIFEIYNVSDILTKVPNFTGPDIRVFDPEGDGGGQVTFEEFDEEDEPWMDPETLIEIIQASTGEDAWPDEEGFGTISYHRGQLLVINTREIHKQIRDILNNLRKNSGIFVIVECRFVDVFDDYLRDVGVDYTGLGADFGTGYTMISNQSGGTDAGTAPRNPNRPGRAATIFSRMQNMFDGYQWFGGARLQGGDGWFLRSTWLEPFQLSALVHLEEEIAKTHRMTAAIITAHNRQRVYISVLNQRAYIADYDVTGGGIGLVAAEVADPIVKNFQEGLVLDVKPIVSSDRKYITIDVRPTLAALTTPTISTIIVNLGTTTPAAIQAPIEIPEISLQRAFTTVTVPDGGTALLGGLKEITEREFISTIPILGDMPIFRWLFERTGFSNERRNLLILITAKIVVVRDEERRIFGDKLAKPK
ncbi:MAG: hypothetical protein E3J72_01325 [Planctomycetota bacterium]|nr:MAG: hypothetical protein E3J72_01325 [Planctomycetota bacterium]